ncbi:MAG TPA: GtrA family protein [Polyangia bacterium]|nr:GtrA family protein [Polyangia bacterium]
MTDGADAAPPSPPSSPKPPSHARTLTRSTIASIAATASEFILLPILVHVLHVREWIAYSSVQFVANAISFLLYKYWAFEAAEIGNVRTQYAKQLLIFAGSLVLNTAIPSFFSYRLHLEPVLAFLISQVVVYIGWNYPGNRYWVFKR